MKVNRKIPPPIQSIERLALPPALLHALHNGIPVYEVRGGTQDVIKVEVVYRAGRCFEHKHLVGRATARLLREGTATRSSADIAEAFDFYGATLSTSANLDTAHISLICLKKHLSLLLPIVAEIIATPTFPQTEIITFKDNNKQRLRVDLTKSDTLAYRHITEMMFGVEHAYGYNSTEAMYDALTREDLLQHVANTYTSDNCTIFIAGKTDEHALEVLNTCFGQHRTQAQLPIPNLNVQHHSAPQRLYLKNKTEGVQSAIRIGRRLFNRHHTDYKGMFVLNTIMGGYFSSRLMRNIREAKGFTYNIYSSLDPMLYDGYFYIGAEVGNAFVKKALKEIYKEINVLQQDLVPDSELSMVRNYLMGSLLAMTDGPFNTMEAIKTLVTENVPLSHFEAVGQVVRSISPEDLRELAQRYLSPADLWEVVVGN